MTHKNRHSVFHRAFHVGISVAFAFTNVAAVYASESTFWTERRRASLQKMRGGEDIPIAAVSSNPHSQMVLAQLPHASPMELGRSSPPHHSADRNDKNELFSLGPKTGDWLGKLVMPYGSVNDVYLSPKPDAPFVVHIQDAHGIEEAQRNIASMIGLLTQEPGIRLVGLEGASGPFSLAPYLDFPNPAMRQDVADVFLRKGLIAGPEYAGLTLPQSPQFFGAENNGLYMANVVALKTGYKEKEGALATFNALQSDAEKLKETIYSKTLKTFDTHFQAYHADKEKLADYVRYLIAQGPSLRERPSLANLQLLVEALDEENTLDFSRVDAERKQLVDRLVEKLAKADLQDLVNKSVDFRAGRMGLSDYHAHLRKICLDHKIALADFPQLTRYISYVLFADKIDRKSLLSEMDLLERTLPESLAKSSEEKKLVSIAHDLVLLKKLLRHEMAMADWTTFQTRREAMYRFGPRMMELNTHGKISPGFTKESLKPFEDFCSYATQRNTALTENFSRELDKEKRKSGILVAGGFHTEGLSGLLRQRQISYVVVTPKITNVPTNNPYLDILAKDPVPLEQLLAGDRIYLSDAIALASNSDKAKTLIAIKDLLVGRLGTFVGVIKGLAVTTDPPSQNDVIGKFSTQGTTVYFVRNHLPGSSILNWAKSQTEKLKSAYLRVTTQAAGPIVRWGKNRRLSLQQLRSWLARHHQWEAVAATGVSLGFSVFNVSLIVMGGFAVVLVFLHVWLNLKRDYAQYLNNSVNRNRPPLNKSIWIFFYVGSGFLVIPLLFAAYSSPIFIDHFLSLQLNFLNMALVSGVTGMLTYQILHSPWDRWVTTKGIFMKAAVFNADNGFSQPKGNMVQEARLDVIREREGILDPSLPICEEVESLARSALVSLGLPPEEYAIVVSDSDDVNAMFYGIKDEKVIVFNRGLLVKLQEEGIFDRDSILFVLGHEGGHALQKVREEQDKDYRPSGLIAEYDADEKGLNALDAGVEGTAFSPRAGLRVMDIFKKGRKTNSYTLTHPHPHRRLAKMFNDIRHRYWQRLDGVNHPLPSNYLKIERTAPYKFNEELYSTFSSSHLERMAAQAGSLLELKRIIHLHHAFTVFRAIFNSYIKENSPVSLDLRPEIIRPLLESTTSASDGASFVLKWMADEGLDPQSFYSEANLTELKSKFPEGSISDALLARILAEQSSAFVRQLRQNEKERESNNLWTIFYKTPPESIGGREKGWRDSIQSEISQIEKGSGVQLKDILREKAVRIVPGLSSLNSQDQSLLIESYILLGLKFLETKSLVANGFTGYLNGGLSEIVDPIQWNDPAAVLKIYLSTKREYSNEFASSRNQNPIFRFLSEFEWEEVGELSLSRENTRQMSLVMDQLKTKSNLKIKTLAELYQIFYRYKNVRSEVSGKIEYEFFELLFTKMSSAINSVDEFIEVFGSFEEGTSAKRILESVMAKESDRDSLIRSYKTLLQHDRLSSVAVSAMPYFVKSLDALGVSPEEGTQILNTLRLETNVDLKLSNVLFNEFLGMKDPGVISINAAYSYWVRKATSPESRLALACQRYAQVDHADVSPFFSLREYRFRLMISEGPVKIFRPNPLSDGGFVDTNLDDSILKALRESFDGESMSKEDQLIRLIQNGIVADRALWDDVVNASQRNFIFESLLNNEHLFLKNNLSQDQFNTLVSMVAWAWFYKSSGSLRVLLGVGENKYSWLDDFAKRLRPSIFNERALGKIKILLCSSPPRHKAEWDSFFKFTARLRSPLNSKDISGIPESAGGKNPPVWGWAKENPKGHPALAWGDDLFAVWLSQNMGSTLETTLDVILKCYPEPSEYRNYELIHRIGNPLRDNPEKFRSILPHLRAGPLREILAKRLMELDLPTRKDSLHSLTDVDAFLMTYFPNESEIKTEIRDQLLQDIELTADELIGLQSESAIERASRSSALGIGHRVIETLADKVENDNPAAKRDAFEWLMGIQKNKPKIISSYETTLKVDLDDLPVLLSLATETDRYLFLTTLILGPKGLLSDEKERRALLDNIFSYGMKSNPQGNRLFEIFRATFEACPEMKQMDLVSGIFRHFLGSRTTAETTPSTLIRTFLSSFGLVGVKLGQILSTLSPELREVLESLSDQNPPLDKRYLLGSLLFDHSLEWVKGRLKSIGRLIGSASIKQGYLVTRADGTQRALKYIRPLARYEVQENMAIAKSVISSLRQKGNGFDHISDNLLEQLDAAVQRELDMANEIKNQRAIGDFSRGETFNGWTFDVPRVDESLEGAQFFADEFIQGEPLKEEMITRLKKDEEYENVAGLIYGALLREILLFGRYHADLQPGNIFVDTQSKIVRFLDFGNTATLSEQNQNTFVLLVAALKFRNVSSAMVQFLRMTGQASFDAETEVAITTLVSTSPTVDQALRDFKELTTRRSLVLQGEFEILFKVFETIKYISGSLPEDQSAGLVKRTILQRQLSPARLFVRLPTTLKILFGMRWVHRKPTMEEARLPVVRQLGMGEDESLSDEFETEIGRYEVRSGADIFIIAHRVSPPLGEAQEVYETLKIVRLTRNGENIEIPRGPNGIWEFQVKRQNGTAIRINSEQMGGISHAHGEAPFFAGTALMSVMLKEVAGLGVPIVGVLAIKNAETLEREILSAREKGRGVTFEDLQKVPALRDPECEYGFHIDDDGVARYTKKWLGQGEQSRLDDASTELLKSQENFDQFLSLQEEVREELSFAAAIPGMVRFIRVVLVSLVKLFPNAGWTREWKNFSRDDKLNRIIRVYAPFLESFFMAAAYFLVLIAMPLIGFAPGLLLNGTSLTVLNVIFGFLHTEVYRKNPATGKWELLPATRGIRARIAGIGLAIHSPLLLSTLDPVLAPFVMVGFNLAATLFTGFLHRAYNDLVVPRRSLSPVYKIAKDATLHVLAKELRVNILGSPELNLKLNTLTKSGLSPLIAQMERGDISEDRLIENLRTIGKEDQIKAILRQRRVQLEDETSSLIARMFEFAGSRWAERSSGPLAIAMHDWGNWQNNANFIAFLNGAIGSAVKSERRIVIATLPDQQNKIRSIFRLPPGVLFRDNEIQGQILDAGKFAKAAETKTLLAANANRMENTLGLDLFYLELISRVIKKEIEWLRNVMAQA